jgi:formylglycine-generating enzyme required for sulfatase activity
VQSSLLNFSPALAFVLLIFADQLQAQSPKEITNSIGMKMVLVPKGTFMMPSPESDVNRQKNEN